MDAQYSLIKKHEDDEFYIKNKNIITHAHNDFLEILSDSGIFALFLSLYIYVYLLKLSYLSDKKEVFLFFIVFGVFSLFSFPIRLPAHSFLFFLFSYLVFYDERNYEKEYRLNFKHGKVIIFLLITVFILSGLRFSIMPVISKIYEYKADEYLGKDNVKYEKLLDFAAKSSFFSATPYIKRMYFLALNKTAPDKIRKMADNLKRISNDYRIWFSLAYTEETCSNFEKASFLYEKSAIYSKHFYLPYERELLIALRLNRPKKAVEILERAVKFEHYIKFYAQLAEISYRIKDKKRAIKYFTYLKDNIDTFDVEGKEKLKILKASYYRLYKLTGNKEYLKKASDIKVKSYVDLELKKEKKI
jgi:hypothetical protein